MKSFGFFSSLLFPTVLVIFNLGSVNAERYKLIPALRADYNYDKLTQPPNPKGGVRINPHTVQLDPETGLNLTWAVNPNLRSITLTIESNRKSGHVALALIKQEKEKLEGADVVVVGTKADGTPFVLDMNGADQGTISQDPQQSWRLELDESESKDGMRISIRRALNSCDDKDIVIGDEPINVAFDQGDDASPSQFDLDGIKEITFVDPGTLPKAEDNCDSEILDDSKGSSRNIRTVSPLELEEVTSTSPSPKSETESESKTELEEIRSDEQDPADDRYGIGYYRFFPKLALARLRLKFLLSKFPKNYIKFKYIK